LPRRVTLVVLADLADRSSDLAPSALDFLELADSRLIPLPLR
jgi:hypothetical protein